MPISWNEIRDRAIAFSKEWEGESSEDAEAKSFWDDFFSVFGISRRRVASFETPVKKSDGRGGYIDLLWKGVLVVEHKSLGKNLDRAFKQAKDYFSGLKERDLPRYVLVSDFENFRLFDLDEGRDHEFALRDLHRNVRLFGFIAGYETRFFGEQDPVNIAAAEKLGKLHDQLKSVGYEGHALEVFLVRLLFCLFAEDNSIFERQQFRELVELRSAEDGSDLAALLANLFQVLNTSPEKRLRILDEQLAEFAYINGKLFAEVLPVAAFDKKMREALLDCTSLNWARISPAIFGALFQSIMDKKARRNLGAHYTSEKNILKALNPLFLDRLREELERAKKDKRRLIEFHGKLKQIRILDPACGCGNFLVIAYRELRLLELDLLRELYKSSSSGMLDVSTILHLDVDQFYGIEIEEFPAQIAQVALWMTDHQMNLRVSEEFGQYFARLPLKKSPPILHGNALLVDWATLIPPGELSYIVGNPPFIGKKEQKAAQKKDFSTVMGQIDGSGVLDFVAAWYVKAVEFMLAAPEQSRPLCALVSTNSITQGEQVAPLWSWMLRKGVKIRFGHRTFAWTSEAKGKAAVHCVIIGFGIGDAGASDKTIFEYDDVKGEPHAVKAANINPYLVDFHDLVLSNVRRPLPRARPINYGSFALDDGHYTLEPSDREELLARDSTAGRFMRPFVGGEELINGLERWCLWLNDADPKDIRSSPAIWERVAAVRKWRLSRDRDATRRLAETPARFAEIRQPKTPYIAIPTVSSERRRFIPIAILDPRVIASNQVYVLPDAGLYELGVLMSTMHNAWMRYTCGRLKSDFRYSAGIVYNNFPWPASSEKQRLAIEAAAQDVLDARSQFPKASLAELYDPVAMPSVLAHAHQRLDRVVDSAYGKSGFKKESDRIAFLFALHEEEARPLDVQVSPAAKPKQRRKATRPLGSAPTARDGHSL